jgi:glycosyltransferase involved in cell wall biosynthesis
VDARSARLARPIICAYPGINAILGCGDAVPVSAFIITKNEEARLPRTLAALRSWVDEIIVVDSGSADRTVEIARSMGATVLHRDWTGYGPQKRYAEECCRNEWVLNVDADEVVTPDLAREIQSLFRDGISPEPDAYKVKILTIYPGDEKPRPFATDYNVVRFYHRAVGSYRDHSVYDRVVLEDIAPKQLRAPILHHPYLSLEHVIEKNNRFSTFRANSSKTYGPMTLRVRLIFEFPISFVKYYVCRLHCTGGWKGFYFSLSHAFMRTSRIAKILEREPLPSGAEQRDAFESKIRHPRTSTP